MRANPWQPITDPKDLKHLGKLGEEVNELGSAIARCVIQGLDGKIPFKNKTNKKWLEEEIADTLNMIDKNIKHFDLDMKFISARIKEKDDFISPWLEGEID